MGPADNSASEPFEQSIEHVRSNFSDEAPKDKSPIEVQLARKQDLLESLDSSVNRLERALRPVLKQSSPSDAVPGGLTTKSDIHDFSSPHLQMLGSQNERATGILVHLNNIIDALEI